MNINIPENNKLKRAAALSLLIILPILLWAAVVMPYWNMLGNQFRESTQVHRKYQSLEYLVNNSAKINQSYRSMANNRSLSEVYLASKGGTLATVKLQGGLKRILNNCGGVLIQSSGMKSKDENEYTVSVSVTMTGDIKSTYCSLHKIENSWPVMTVNNVDISRGNSTQAKDNQDVQLQARYDVTAYIRK